MFCTIVLSLGLALLVGGENKMPCECNKMHEGFKCCKKEMQPWYINGDLTECMQMMRKPPSCDAGICVARKLGFASSDGSIDFKALESKLDTWLEKEPELLDRIKDNCITGDLGKYGKEDFCDVFKLKMCSDIQYIKSCSEWKDDGDCKGIKDLAAECTKVFD